MRFTPLFAFVFAAFALFKSRLYHGYGQLKDEQLMTMAIAGMSLCMLVAPCTRLPRYRSDGRRKLIVMVTICVVTLACDVLAIWSISTAMVGAKDQLF